MTLICSLLIMNDSEKITHYLDVANRHQFTLEDGKAADCWKRIAEIALERYAMAQNEIGNDPVDDLQMLLEDVINENMTL